MSKAIPLHLYDTTVCINKLHIHQQQIRRIPLTFLLPPEVSASFQSGTSISYAFTESHDLGRNSSAVPSSIHSDLTLRGENVSLSFRTNQSPAMLVHVGSYYREYLALLINKQGEGFYFEGVCLRCRCSGSCWYFPHSHVCVCFLFTILEFYFLFLYHFCRFGSSIHTYVPFL